MNAKFQDGLEKIKAEGEELKNEIRQRTAGYIMGALGIVVGLAWNEAIKASIEYLFPLGQNTIVAKFLYASALTIFLVLFSMYVLRADSGQKK